MRIRKRPCRLTVLENITSSAQDPRFALFSDLLLDPQRVTPVDFVGLYFVGPGARGYALDGRRPAGGSDGAVARCGDVFPNAGWIG